MNIILIGIQGCGKGTLVSGLQEHYNISLISMGQLLREEIATGSELGKQIKEKIDKGELVSIDIIKNTLDKKLNNIKDGLTIFDGFPRNIEQADLLDSIANVDLVIHLYLSKETAKARILNRLTCGKCGYITKKQDVENDICPQCGGKLVQRSDDTEEGIRKRFEIYEKETYPLIERYRSRGVLVEIDANQSRAERLEIALKVINEHLN